MCLCTVHLEDQREGRWEGEREREREVRRGKDEERGERRESCLCTEAKDQWQTVGQVRGDGFGLRHREAIVSFTGLLSCLTARTMYICTCTMYVSSSCTSRWSVVGSKPTKGSFFSNQKLLYLHLRLFVTFLLLHGQLTIVSHIVL